MIGVKPGAWWAAALALPLGLAAAQPASAPAGLPADLIKALNSDVLEDREEAARQILSGGEPAAQLRAVEAAIRQPGLSAEQRERLATAGLRLFESTPRAAMGVTISGTGSGDPVTVSPTVPGFDAFRLLRDGDVVTAADDHPITTDFDLRCLIVSHDPGDEVSLSIQRSGEPMVVKLKLGRFSDLKNNGSLSDPIMAGAWDRRMDRVAPRAVAPLAGDAGEARWAAALQRARAARAQRSEPMNDPSSMEPVRSQLPRPPVATLTIGGQGRDTSGQVGESVAMGPGRDGIQIDVGNLQRQRIRDEIELIRLERSVLVDQLNQIEAELALPNTTPERRQYLSALSEQARVRLQMLEQRRNAILPRLGR